MNPATQPRGPETPPAQIVLAGALLARVDDAVGLDALLAPLSRDELVEVVRNAVVIVAELPKQLAGEEHVDKILQCFLAEVADTEQAG